MHGVHPLELLIAEQFLREGLSRGSTAYIIWDININQQLIAFVAPAFAYLVNTTLVKHFSTML